MTTDLVEKCARAAFAVDSDDLWNAQPATTRAFYAAIALAVIDALADGVSDEMATEFARVAGSAPPGFSFSVTRRALTAAIRAAKTDTREGQMDTAALPTRRNLSPEEVEAMMVPELVKAIYPGLIPVEQQNVQIQQRNHKRITEIATAIWRQFSQFDHA